MSPFANAVVKNWRNRVLGVVMVAACLPLGVASAQTNIDAKVVETIPLGSSSRLLPAFMPSGVAYSNVALADPTEYIIPGAALLDGSNRITRSVVDDIKAADGFSGWVSEIVFAVVNTSASDVTARTVLRLWADFPSVGSPGNYYQGNSGMTDVGFHFGPTKFAAHSTTILTASIASGDFALPTKTFWCGLQFDNDNGLTGANQSDLESLGAAMATGPTVGTSSTKLFRTMDSKSFLGVDSPSVDSFDPSSNLYLKLTVDGATPATKSTWGRVKQLYR